MVLLSDGETTVGRLTSDGAAEAAEPSTLDWLKSVRNVVKFGGAGHGYKDVEKYLRREGLY